MAELSTEAHTGDLGDTDGFRMETYKEAAHDTPSETQPEEIERKARVDAIWQQMNRGVSSKTLNSILNKRSSTVNRMPAKTTSKMPSPSWMTVLGLSPKKMPSPGESSMPEKSATAQNGTDEDAKKLAAAALSAVREAANAAASSGRGKIEITEVRDFAGEDIEVKKFVDATSKEASDRVKAPVGPASAVDAILEQIKKKQKLSVLDKTKKDWEEFKEENKGMEDELDAYKKSSNQYLDKVSFLQRTDYREFERERDVRLALQAKRKPDMREEP